MKRKIMNTVMLLGLGLLSAGALAQDYPACSSSSSDPDGDGWGWENDQSCQVSSSSSNNSNNSSSNNTSSSNNGGQCDWYGTPTPVCSDTSSGWGWENNQSCVASSTCAEAGGSSSSSNDSSNNNSNNTDNSNNNNSSNDSNSGTPVCASSSSDDDGDGWGWENEQSCQVTSSSSSNNNSNNNSSNNNSSSNSGGQCDWYGTPTPVCNDTSSGWGWENNQSCVASSTCAEAGGSSSSNNSSNNNNNSSNNNSGSNNSSSSAGSCPSNLSCPSGADCGCYTVSGLGANKQAYRSAGASLDFLAGAMMETEMMDTNYAYGDNKTGDAFNAGACKQNWGMMRQCHSAWNSYGSGDYSISDEMNSNKALDVQVYNECHSYFGGSWMAGHRNGSSGLDNPNTADIQRFKDAHAWTVNQLSGHETDDVRFWVDVPAI